MKACDTMRPGIHEAHRRRLCTKFRQHRLSPGPLQRDQRAIRQRLDNAGVGKVLAQMRFIGGLAGRVDHKEQVVAKIRHHEIVEDAAGIVGELRVALPAWG